MKTLSSLQKELNAVDSKINEFPEELFRLVRLVESIKRHLAESVSSLNISHEVFDSGSLDESNTFIIKNHKAFSRIRSRLAEEAPLKIVLDHYTEDKEFLKQSKALIALGEERHCILAGIKEVKDAINKLEEKINQEAESAKQNAIRELEQKGNDAISLLKEKISRLK